MSVPRPWIISTGSRAGPPDHLVVEPGAIRRPRERHGRTYPERASPGRARTAGWPRRRGAGWLGARASASSATASGPSARAGFDRRRRPRPGPGERAAGRSPPPGAPAHPRPAPPPGTRSGAGPTRWLVVSRGWHQTAGSSPARSSPATSSGRAMTPPIAAEHRTDGSDVGDAGEAHGPARRAPDAGGDEQRRGRPAAGGWPPGAPAPSPGRGPRPPTVMFQRSAARRTSQRDATSRIHAPRVDLVGAGGVAPQQRDDLARRSCRHLGRAGGGSPSPTRRAPGRPRGWRGGT